jgi:tetratricopeptide (TPR) repeat protein
LTKKVEKTVQNDAMYYIAYNQMNLGENETAYQTILKLKKREKRTDKVAEQSILQARILDELNQTDEAIEMLETIATDNPRTTISAEAIFYIAEIQFRKLHDYETAIENYNRVRRETQRSDFADKAVARSAVVSQIVQYRQQNPNMRASQLVNDQFKLAEYYLYELSLPDSAIVIYQKLPYQRNHLQTRIDSLNYIIQLYEYINYVPPIEFEETEADTTRVIEMIEPAETPEEPGEPEESDYDIKGE